ncbi:unnamed protein product [Sphagnum jensenii]
MCGIFAYINCHVPRERRHILEVLFNGLRRLEYRGYDSAGISIDADNDDHLEEVKKKKGLGLGGEAARQLSPPLVFREEGKIEKLVTSVYQGVTPFLNVVAITRRIYHHIANSGLIIFQSSTGSGFCLILVGVLEPGNGLFPI